MRTRRLVVGALAAVSCVSAFAKEAPGKQSGPERETVIAVSCKGDSREPNAWYVGPYLGYDNNLKPEDFARDFYCAEQFKSTFYPKGYVTIYGSSSISEFASLFKSNAQADGFDKTAVEKEYSRIYAEVMTFAYLWSKEYGQHHQYPIMTGAGPGLMEAGSRGAHDAGLSIGYTTYYDKKLSTDTSPHGWGGVPGFVKYPLQAEPEAQQVITSEGLIFSSVSARETAMILHSAAIVIAPGGAGTEWETFQILEMTKSHQLRPVPIYFIGEQYHWESLNDRIKDMEDRGTLKKGVITLEHANCPADLVKRISERLGLRAVKLGVDVCSNKSDYEQKALRVMQLMQ
nr:LOG family protein [uncultured Pseudoxanthomonas sp.]